MKTEKINKRVGYTSLDYWSNFKNPNWVKVEILGSRIAHIEGGDTTLYLVKFKDNIIKEINLIYENQQDIQPKTE